MKKYAICCNKSVENYEYAQDKVKSILNDYGISAIVFDIENLKNGCDFIFVIGGDGTILKAARYFSKYNATIFGINLGHLGFLSQAGLDELKNVVKDILNDNYNVEKRLMLESNNYCALNDFVIKSADSSRASVFKLEVDSKFVCEYYADGLIIATPTGSTAYSMAAGGPVINPELNVLSVVPICPHTFSARPLIVSSSSLVKIYAPPKQNYCVSADGQVIFSYEDEILVKASKNYANLALLKNNDFYSVLRNKLHWGITPGRF